MLQKAGVAELVLLVEAAGRSNHLLLLMSCLCFFFLFVVALLLMVSRAVRRSRFQMSDLDDAPGKPRPPVMRLTRIIALQFRVALKLKQFLALPRTVYFISVACYGEKLVLLSLCWCAGPPKWYMSVDLWFVHGKQGCLSGLRPPWLGANGAQERLPKAQPPAFSP